MGDRANIAIRTTYTGDKDAPAVASHEAVFLYGHWSGYDLPENLRRALDAGRDRWDDAAYLARIVFDQGMRRDADGETGFGISTRLTDNEYDLLVLLPWQGRLVRVPEKHYRAHGFTDIDDFPSIAFADYVAAPERTWDNLTEVEVRAV